MAESNSTRKPRRVVRLSRVDQERLAREEISTSTEVTEKARVSESADRLRAAHKKRQIHPRDAHERELLADRPPHFGKL